MIMDMVFVMIWIGGSIHRTIYNIFCEKWVFSLKMYKFVREIWVAADSQRRRNNCHFPLKFPLKLKKKVPTWE